MLDHSELLDRTFHSSLRKLLFSLHALFLQPNAKTAPGRSAESNNKLIDDWYYFSRAAGFFFSPNGMEIAEMKKVRSYFITGNYDNSGLE